MRWKNKVTVGDVVFHIADPTHLGRLDRVDNGMATITWQETGWISTDLCVYDLRHESKQQFYE